MSDARFPGPLGGSITPQIDGGTLARIASPLPGIIGFEDPAVEWARRQLRRGVRRGLELAVDAAYDAAMAELRRLRNDVEAALQLISKLPDTIKRRVAYEFFAAFFSHYLPKKLIHHYVYGGGGRLNLTLQEAIDCNPHINLQRSQAFRDALDAAAKQPGVPVALPPSVLAGALTNGTLGQFTVRLKGTLTVLPTGDWTAQGTMSFYDEWDFDPKDWTTGGRSLQGEVKTRIANALLPGDGYQIHGPETPFTQSGNDQTLVWAGGTPKSDPDRIAELDYELSKPDR